jgi:hypothetical protein
MSSVRWTLSGGGPGRAAQWGEFQRWATCPAVADLPAPAQFLWRIVGQYQYRRKVGKIRAGLERS